jgi:ABC-type amino acid transport substrate-binding protein
MSIDRMRLIFSAILAAVLAFAGTAMAQTLPSLEGQTLHVVLLPATPLFSQRQPDGKITGFNADMVREICRLLKANCIQSVAPLAVIIEKVAGGEVELGMANLLKTPERERRLLYSEPYWRSTSSLVGRRGMPDISLADAAQTKQIAAVRGSRQFDAITRLGATANLVPGESSADMWQALRDGRAEIVLTPTLHANGFLLSPQGQDFTTIGPPISDEGVGGPVHIVFPLGRRDLKQAVDAAIERLRVDGTYQALSRRYFSFDIY